MCVYMCNCVYFSLHQPHTYLHTLVDRVLAPWLSSLPPLFVQIKVHVYLLHLKAAPLLTPDLYD